MLSVLNKLFVRSFYRANTGFFLFFFFLFFGAVEGGSLLSYHLSLMKSMLQSTTVLLLVMLCWTLYHLKCVGYFLKIINGAEGSFLVNLQALNKRKQFILYAALYAAVYSPVFIYGCLVFIVGVKRGYATNAVYLLLYQFLTVIVFTTIIFYRANHWLESINLPAIKLPIQNNFSVYLLHHFTTKRKKLLLGLKFLSLSLLYLVLVWNKSRYDNDAFLLFYLVLFLAHALLPYLAVQFFETEFAMGRNLPVSLFQRTMALLIPYFLLVLPEAVYILYHGSLFSFSHKLAYIINLPVSLFLLTAIQYSGAQNREEYVKATFALIFVSLFFFHVQAFWLWLAVQLVIATVLFMSSYYSFEKSEE